MQLISYRVRNVSCWNVSYNCKFYRKIGTKMKKSTSRKSRKKLDELLRIAVEMKDWDEVRELLRQEFEVGKMNSGTDIPTLHFAADLGRADLVDALIQNGADVKAVTKNKWTALHLASTNGHVDTVKRLIQNGADVNAIAEYHGTALCQAAKHGRTEVAKVLIQKGADVNTVDKESKFTPLHLASCNGYNDVAKLLIQNGAAVNAECYDKSTPLHDVKDDADIVKTLIFNGAFVNCLNSRQETPLSQAASLGQIPIILQLVCCDANIDTNAVVRDKSKLLRQIRDKLNLLRDGKPMETTLMSDEERRFMWNLAFFFTIKYGGAHAFKVYYTIHSFITFHGIFMSAPGYDYGVGSIWRRPVIEGDDFW